MFSSSNEITNIAKAVLAVQGKVVNVRQQSTASKGSAGSYTYANLPDTLDEIRPAMQAAGVVLVQAVTSNIPDPTIVQWGEKWDYNRKVMVPLLGVVGVAAVETRVIHAESGEWMACSVEGIANMLDVQALGSAITYLRRYSLMSLLGMSSEKDDGQVARGAETGSPPQAPTTTAPPPPPKTQLDDYKTRLAQRCVEKGRPVPNMDGWSVEKIRDVGVWLAKNGDLPPDIEGARTFHED